MSKIFLQLLLFYDDVFSLNYHIGIVVQSGSITH